MPVITAQTGPLLSAPQFASAAPASAVQGQGEQPALPGDWQAALAELDALLQAALPASAQAGNTTPAPTMATAQDTTTVDAETPADQTARAQTPPDLHTALRRLTQGAGEEQTDTQASTDSDAEPAPLANLQPVEVNAALLRQLHAVPVTAHTTNVSAEARADLTVDADAPRAERAPRGFEQPAQFSRPTTVGQGNVDVIARIETGAAGALRIEGFTPESSAQPFNLPTTTTTATSTTHEWAPLKLGDKSAQWGQQLLDTLRERVEMQVNQQVKQAHIRLDPPELGRLELTVRLDGDHLSVQINANHAQLRDALLQTGERLRAALMPQHAGGVSVDVGQGAPDDRSGQPRGEQGILAGRRSSAELEADLNELAPAGWLNTLV